MEVLYQNLLNLDFKMVIMWLIGGVLIWLAVKKDMEPTLLLPMGFGAILVNLPLSGAITQGAEEGPLSILYGAGIANERHHRAAHQLVDHGTDGLMLIELVMTAHGRCYAEVLEQYAARARILGKHRVDGLEHLDGPGGHVAEVPHGGWHDI